jgi:ABC-type polysaccharide/polyol phosphate transport system ATPase subunit
MAIDVRCEGVSKQYHVRRRRRGPGARSLTGMIQALAPKAEEFWALRRVSFDVLRGETLGIIGRNGAGKSTLLKLLGGITSPTEGEITLHGRLAAMIEVGSGFHPELTGRENVFLSGAIVGMRRREIAARLDSIADFSGIGAFLDTPVKFYSSGMYVRLGFAIVAHLEAEILIVDEVLAVGDAEFQARCLQRMQDLKRRGTTMIIVSHDLGAVEQLSDRALLFNSGQIAAAGSPHDVISSYQRLVDGAGGLAAGGDDDAAGGSQAIRVSQLTLLDESGISVLTANAGAPLVARVALEFTASSDAAVTLSIYEFESGTLITQCAGEVEAGSLGAGPMVVSVDFVMPELLLAPGVYTLGATVTPRGAPQPVAWRFGRTTLYVQGSGHKSGVYRQPFQCRVVAQGASAAGVTLS